MMFSARIILPSALVWFMQVSIFIQPAQAGEKDAAALIRVPVFFITDRNLASNNVEKGAEFGPHRKYIGDCAHDPYMGVAQCVIENSAHQVLTPELEKLGWSNAANEKKSVAKATIISADNFAIIQDQFYSHIVKDALNCQRKEIFLFAHGYNNSFTAALNTAAKIGYYSHTPIILYSWPSVAKLNSYTSDENNVEWSQEHFNDVISRFGDLCASEPTLKIRLFAHSMGSRLLVRASPFLKERPFLKEMSLVCPDVDDGLVKHYARRYLSVNGTTLIRLYMSQRDKALALSQLVHGGYCRLGECADALSTFVNQTVAFATGQDGKGLAAADDKAFKERVELTKHRMQTIDFTNLDKGLIGHNVPAELVCNMALTGVPGDGLELISQKSGERSKASRLFSNFTRLRQSSPVIGGTCLRVVKLDSKQLSKSQTKLTSVIDSEAR